MLTYHIGKREDESKYYFLYKEIRKDILTGNLKPNEKLPSKRSLAEHLGLSLITVENAYQMLKEEGYIESRERSGYFVCQIPILNVKKEKKEQVLHMLPEGSLRGEGASEANEDAFLATEMQAQKDANFPYSLYFKTVRGVITDYGEALMERSPNEGCAILRNAIAKYLLRYRGIYAQPEQIIIGSGAEHLYGSIVRIFGNDKVYGIENPSYHQIQKVYEGTGAKVELLEMGKHGITKEALEKTEADILHVTPFHSYPSGVSASVSKRYEYINWAREGGHYIVEDDYDSEFFMPGKPVETLYSMEEGASVIYINTFSKSLSPSIRMGYMIVPMELLERYKETNGGFSCTVPVLDQYALAEFMNKGYFEQHLNRVRRRK